MGHLAEDNEDDFTPVGSPSSFTIDELKTRLRGVDGDLGMGGEISCWDSPGVKRW